MQFITVDNRIAVENFQVGYFYVITFNNHNYIITTCTGIGENFVSFLCSEPELVFDLTMQNADSIATIDLYGGGTGTTDYNNLSNKPSINNVLLVGNKTTSDLLINDVPTVTSADDSKVLVSSYSGGVGSYSWVTYSPISSYNDLTDKPTINSVTLSGNKTSGDLGLQSEINSENPLLSDNVDDTNQTHKFATVAQLEQIATNQTNISLIKHAANTSIYIQETKPTGAVGDYWISAANGVKTYGRTDQLFNIDDSSMLYNGYINNNLDSIAYSASGSKTAKIPCTAGTQYTIAVNSKTLRIAGIATAPVNDAPILSPYRQQYDTYEKHTYTYTAPEGAIYLLVNCYISTVEMADEKSIDDVFGTLMVNEGSTAAEFAPYYDWV